MTESHYWVDGQSGDAVSASDRAIQYGDGLFETIRIRESRLEFIEHHLDRLVSGCERLAFPDFDRNALKQELIQRASAYRYGVLKVILSRGGGSRGYRPDPDAHVSRIISVHPMTSRPGEPQSRGIQVRICDTRLAIQPALAGIKHLNRLEQVLARNEWDDPQIAEGLMLDINGQLIEATMSNLFLVCDNVLMTPSLTGSGVAGVMRSVILDLAKQQAIEVKIQPLTLERLRDAQDVFVCNSLIGIWPVIRVIGLADFAIGPITRRLQKQLKEQGGSIGGSWYSS